MRSCYHRCMTNPSMKILLGLLTLAIMTRAASALDSVADAKQCSEAALASYALTSAEPAEKIAEMAFRRCSDKWREAFDPVGREMDASPTLKEAQENCIKRLGPSSCPAPLPSIVVLMNAAQRTFQSDAVTKVFDIRAKVAGK
ncbi:hypothetical protein ABID58_001804 [Bradyrhizobium sp. S3.2.6]